MINECCGVVINNMITYRLTDHEEDVAVLLITHAMISWS